MNSNNVIERLSPVFERVNQQIKIHLRSDIPFVSQVCDYILLSGGKRLRPALFILATHLCGYDGDREYHLSTALEYLHAATLLHDDVVDDSDTRRGRTAAHLVYGNQGVILVGDFLLAKSLSLASETGHIRFTEVMSNTVACMAEGEVLQLFHAGDPNITEHDYEQVIHRKTGRLIESSCYLGAFLAEAPDRQAECLRDYGRNVGLAFQMVDDALDYSTTSAEFGKPVGHDLDEGKITLPIIRTLTQASQSERSELTDLIKKERRTDQEFFRIKEIIDKYQGLEQTYHRATQAVETAKSALDIFPDGQVKTDLLDLADFIVIRRK